MGMHDYVDHKEPCPKCGRVLTNWQTKQGENTMALVSPTSVGCFYALCDFCKLCIEYTYVVPPPTSVDQYTRTVNPWRRGQAVDGWRACP